MLKTPKGTEQNTPEILNTENLKMKQILKRIVETRRKKHDSAKKAADSLGIDQRTFARYLNYDL